MVAAWTGPTPTAFTDAATQYELGTKMQANVSITINNIRIWAGPTSVAFANRKARVWNAMGAQVGIANLPNQLTPGWNLYPLVTPVVVSAGSAFTTSYNVQDTYGAAAAPGYPRTSTDGAVSATVGTLHSTPGTYPSNPLDTFYGVDIDYTSAANAKPVVGISTATTGFLAATATLTITDESPATVTYLVKWGDGTSSTPTGLGPHAHTYAAAGTYSVMVVATDNGGLTDSASTTVTVLADPGPIVPDPWLDQVCKYFGGPYVAANHSYQTPTIAGVGVVRRGIPKNLDWAQFTQGMQAGTDTGCMVAVTMNAGDERRETTPAVTGLKHLSATVVLHCFFYSMAAYGEDLQDQVQTVRRAIFAKIRQDNTLGSGGFENRMFQVGEADQHGAGGTITWGTSPPETDEDNTSQQYLFIQFEAHGFVTG